MSRSAVVALTLVLATRVASADDAGLADRLDLGLAWHHVRSADGTSVVVTAAGTSLRNARVGAGVALASAGDPVVRVALTLPLAARAGGPPTWWWNRGATKARPGVDPQLERRR